MFPEPLGYVFYKSLHFIYTSKINRAKKLLSRLPFDKAKIELDLRRLDINLTPTLFLNPYDEGISADLFAWRFREPVNTYMIYNFLQKEKRNIDAVIDIGSNIGYFALLESISKVPLILAIEPIPETFRILQKNLESRNAKALNVAISKKRGTMTMYVPIKLNLATAIRDAVTVEAPLKYTIKIQALRMKDIMKDERLESGNVVVRMDLEGYEKIIIDDIPNSVYALLFEFHSPLLKYNQSKLLIEKLKKKGFQIEYLLIDPKGLEPMVKLLGIKAFLRLYEKRANKPIFHYPSPNIIERTIRKQKTCPHIFARRK